MKERNINDPHIKWSVKEAIILLIISDLSVFLITALAVSLSYLAVFQGLKVVKENPYILVFIINVIVIFIVFSFLKHKNINWGSLGFHTTGNIKALIEGFFTGILIFFIANGIFCFFSSEYILSYKICFERGIHFLLLWPLTFKGFNSVLLTPFIEEVLFRGFLYQALSNKLSRNISILLVSALFSIGHIESLITFNMKFLIIRFLYGIFLTYLFVKTKNILSNIACHSALNLMAWFCL